MANLLTALRNSSMVQKQGITDQTQRAQELLRAKSGKAVASPAVGASNLAEQSAVDQTNQQLEQAQQAANIQQQGIQQQASQQEQQQQLQQQETAQSRRFNQIQNQLQTNELLQNFEQRRGELQLRKDDAATQQLVQGIRFQNKQYIDNLQRAGQEARLQDDISFSQQLAKTTFGNTQDLLKRQLGNREILDVSDREFSRAVGEMNVADAWKTFRDTAKAENERAMWTGLGNLAQAGIGAYGTYASGASTNKQELPLSTATDKTYNTTTYGGGSMES